MFETGGSRPRSLALVLPKGWLRFWGLLKGQELVVIANSVMVIIPPTHANREGLEESVRRWLVDGCRS